MSRPRYKTNNPNTKICCVCLKEKNKGEFNKRDGGYLRSSCKRCCLDKDILRYGRNPQKGRLKNKRLRDTCSAQKLWARATYGQHKAKGIKFNFTVKELENFAYSFDNCSMCELPINWNNNKIQDNSPTLENINCKNLLDLKDVDILCFSCNRTKQDRTMKEFVNYCTYMADKFALKVVA